MTIHLLSDGTTFCYSNTEEPKVCYLHGWGRNSHDFIKIMELYPGIAVDLPGFGKTKSLDHSMNPFEYASYLNDILPPEITTLVGHSFGGRVAVHLSLMREINNLVLIGVPLLSNTRKDRGINKLSIFKFLNKVGLVSTEMIESIKNKSGSIDYRNSEGVMRDTLVKAVNDNLEDKLLEIKSNVKLIWGENDTEVPVSIAKKSRELIANSELTIIPNEGHNMLRSNSNSIIEVLKTL